ncbi:CPBP family glutamic-type intramembrane protease [Stenotrophomonas sp. BSUC-16]|jgi:membrane protease YdiL (CAAX protease family)|uniref:CPBP family glutamic-type intramembrane protease n=1 Tax=Stenotrophomonas TaxID=40323 RepID=UPI001D0FE4FC|nr:CPBP family glutamic-type intramembrane protease [Stenotrophomonas maltophilia]UXB35949.1 CPBP family glutamic-type intramembrane protease [Stenotrophomonas maltophilia]
MRKPLPTPENFLIYAAVSWVAVSFIGMFLADAGMYGAKIVTEAAAFSLLVALFPSEPHRPWSVAVVCIALAGAAVFFAMWLVFFALPEAKSFSFPDPQSLNRLDIVAGFLGTAVVSPLFEEKLARHLALRGIEGVTPPWLSRLVSPRILATLIVSTIFAWAHGDMAVPAFIFSLTLSWLTLKHRFGLLQRALLHGIYNGAVMFWFLSYGFGFYSG